MANEGSTKPTYSELEAENLRVRGLLQRLIVYGSYHATCLACDKTAVIDAGLNPVHEPDCWLVKELSQGAESADIGKLDAADKACDEFRGGDPFACSTCGRPFQDHGCIVLPAVRMTREEFRKRWAGSAETGGEKATLYDALLKLIQFHNQQEVGVPVENERWDEAIRNGRVALGMEVELD